MREPWRGLSRSVPLSTMRCLVRGAIVCLALTVPPTGALAADIANGEVIAKRWCAACHLVSSDQARANADVPSFASLARKKQRPEKLEAFLSAPHPKMPDMNLSRSEIDDLVAYIGSLRR
jgi:mono/diheme cytochrome c family protein